MTIAVREFVDDDISETLKVMRLSLGEPPGLHRTEQLFRWKHHENPFGRSIMLVATDSDRIVGFRAFMRWDLTVPSGETLQCVRPVDTATHPDFQRRGIFRSLTESAVEAARSTGINLIFNTPNPASGAGYQKMGWKIAGDFGVMIRPGIRFIRGTDHLDAPDELFGIDGADRNPFGFRTVRSAEYRTWRFQHHPTAQYSALKRAEGLTIFRKNRRRGLRELVVSEIIGDPGSAVNGLGRKMRSHYAAAWFPVGTPERSALLQRGFIPIPKVSSLTLATRTLTDLPIDPEQVNNWDFGFGDLELL